MTFFPSRIRCLTTVKALSDVIKQGGVFLEKIASGVAGMEAQAEKILEEARKQAQEILLKGREECRAIAVQELPPEENGKAGENLILAQAREEAGRINQETEKRVAEIKNKVKIKMSEISNSIVSLVMGEKS
jgi:hypothetical protein